VSVSIIFGSPPVFTVLSIENCDKTRRIFQERELVFMISLNPTMIRITYVQVVVIRITYANYEYQVVPFASIFRAVLALVLQISPNMQYLASKVVHRTRINNIMIHVFMCSCGL
jgi:hypothetical protein